MTNRHRPPLTNFRSLDELEERIKDALREEGLPPNVRELYRRGYFVPSGRTAPRKKVKRFVDAVRKKNPDATLLSYRAQNLFHALLYVENARTMIRDRRDENLLLSGYFLFYFLDRAGISLHRSKGGRADRRPLGILHAIRREITEHPGLTSSEQMWRHLRAEHHRTKHVIPIDEPDFRGEVYSYCNHLCQDTEQQGKRKTIRRIGRKAFEKYFYAIRSTTR